MEHAIVDYGSIEGLDVWRPGSQRWNDEAFVSWPYGVEKPRTCSHCGGVHPDDAIALLADGWSVELTDKGYKFYMHPPESFAVVPPVKMYLMHWTREQVARADDIVRGRREFMAHASSDSIQ
jgi:hypothetical protein